MVGKYPYSQSFTIRGFECDPYGYLKPSSIQKYSQEVSTGHLETLGLTHKLLMSEGVVFLMTSVATKIYRCPKAGETINIYTSPIPPKGSKMLREVIICDKDDNLLVEIQTGWVAVEPLTHKLLRPGVFKHKMPSISDYQPFCDPQKRKISADVHTSGTRLIRLTDIDRNFHLNNTVYLDIMMDCFGDKLLGANIDSYYIKYKGEAKLLDEIEISTAINGNSFVAMGSVNGGPCFEGEIITVPN